MAPGRIRANRTLALSLLLEGFPRPRGPRALGELGGRLISAQRAASTGGAGTLLPIESATGREGIHPEPSDESGAHGAELTATVGFSHSCPDLS